MTTHNQEKLLARCLSYNYVKHVFERLRLECAKDSNKDTTLTVTLAGVMDECVFNKEGPQLIAEFRLSVVTDVTHMSVDEKKKTEDWIASMLKRSACIPVAANDVSFRVWYRRPMEGYPQAVEANSQKSIGYANINNERMDIGVKKAVDNIYDFLLQNTDAPIYH